MARLTAPNGATVSVADDKAERLVDQGYTPIEEPKKAPAKKAAARKTTASSNE